jgi:acetyl esterase/lipase
MADAKDRTFTIDEDGIPRDDSYTVDSAFAKYRKDYPYITIVPREVPAGIISEEGLVFARYGKRELKLDVYQRHEGPKSKASGPLPGVLMIFGGGWTSGRRWNFKAMAIRLAQIGYVTVTCDYRLSPEAQYPAAVHDLRAAVRWMRANAEKYNIDPKRIGAVGESAGGHLACMLAVTAGWEHLEGDQNPGFDAGIQAAVNLDGPVDFTQQQSLEAARVDLRTHWLGATYFEKPDLWKEASPTYWVNLRTPPTLFVNSQRNHTWIGREEWLVRSKALGIPAEMYVIPDTPHAYWHFEPWFTQMMVYVGPFLERYLALR